MDTMLADPGGERAAHVDQVEFWNSASGQRWVTHQDTLDQRFALLTEQLIERALVQIEGRIALDDLRALVEGAGLPAPSNDARETVH